MAEIDFNKIEKKWQEKWAKAKAFSVKEDKKKKKYYVLEMYPYPSASFLHVGHVRNYTIGDVYARVKRMQGYNVLYPIGFDSFGLPAENAAKKEGIHPKKYAETSIKKITEYLHALGNSYDWDRVIASHEPEYYKWNQYLFLKLYEKGLAYKKKAPVNWCNKCQSVLANEEAESGKCWRCGEVVITKDLEQWFFKITDYVDRLLSGLDKIEWSERIKTMQKNWIGKKEWIDINYKIDGSKESITVSTTKPDTNFGATFVVVAPEHPILSKDKNIVLPEYRKDVDNYIKTAQKKTEEERTSEVEGRKKTGVFTGLYCINQLSKKKMPIWVTDFVMMNVGTGAVVGVPGHDKRDFEFAKEFNLPIIRVVVGKDGDKSEIKKKEQVQEEEGIIINSEFLDGRGIHDATKKAMDYLEEKGWGKRTIRYKIRDWLISRQRYWGTPIPIVYCDKCGIVPVSEKDLPVILPEKVDFKLTNPLAANKGFVETKCPKCGGKAKRETDTMGGFMDSSWYFLRYCDNKNNKLPFDKKKVDYFMPVDQYIGGIEHAVGHLMYARFLIKFLHDIKMVDFDEPFLKLFNQGIVYKDGKKMSKSYGNVVYQTDISNKYGIDTARLFLMLVSSPDKQMEWSDQGVEGSYRVINKLIRMFDNIKKTSDDREEHKINSIIKKVTESIEKFDYPKAIISIVEIIDKFNEGISKKNYETLLKLMSVFCPHICEELWWKVSLLDKSNKNSKNADKSYRFISLEKWPVCDLKKINEKFEKEEVALEKTVADVLNVLKIVEEKQGKIPKKVYIYVIPPELTLYNPESLGKRIQKEVYVFAVNDKNKYDPEGKASKAKPGKPGIFVE